MSDSYEPLNLVESRIPEYDTETLRLQYEEAKRYFDQKLDAHRRISKKGERIVYFNILLVTFLLQFYSFSSYMSLIGVGLLFLSAATGLYVQSPHLVVHGAETETIERTLENEYSEEEWLVVYLTKGYQNWIEDMEKSYEKKLKYLKIAYYLLALGTLTVIGIEVSIEVLSNYGGQFIE